MNEYLDQSEMDALLQDTTDESQDEFDQGTPNDTQGIQPYDLTSPERVLSGRMPRLENANHEMAHQLRVALSGTLRRLVEVRALQPQTVAFKDFLRRLAMPASLHLFRLRPLRGTSLLALEPKLVFALIDTLLGGSGHTDMTTDGRPFTPIESQMILRVVNLVLAELSLAWNSLHTIHIEYERSEINPQFAKIAAPAEVVMIITFEVEMEDIHGNMTLCIPCAALAPLRAKLYAMTRGEQWGINSKVLQRIQRHVQNMEVEASVEVGDTEMSIGALLQLQVGDIIRLEKDVDSELIVKIVAIPKFKGLPCKLNQQKALQVTSRIKHSEENGHE